MKSIEESARECLKRAFMRTAANGHNFMTCSTEEARFFEEDIVSFAKEVQADMQQELFEAKSRPDWSLVDARNSEIEALKASLTTLRVETLEEAAKVVEKIMADRNFCECYENQDEVAHALRKLKEKDC